MCWVDCQTIFWMNIFFTAVTKKYTIFLYCCYQLTNSKWHWANLFLFRFPSRTMAIHRTAREEIRPSLFFPTIYENYQIYLQSCIWDSCAGVFLSILRFLITFFFLEHLRWLLLLATSLRKPLMKQFSMQLLPSNIKIMKRMIYIVSISKHFKISTKKIQKISKRMYISSA